VKWSLALASSETFSIRLVRSSLFDVRLGVVSSLMASVCWFAARWAETTSQVPTIHLNSIPTNILEKVIQYFHYKQRYDHVAKRPKFDIPLDIVTQVLLAANFLDT
jgi:hypothetical protein